MVHVMAVTHVFLVFLLRYNAYVLVPGISVAKLNVTDAQPTFWCFYIME